MRTWSKFQELLSEVLAVSLRLAWILTKTQHQSARTFPGETNLHNLGKQDEEGEFAHVSLPMLLASEASPEVASAA